jgi:predicted nucleotidyltransferase
MGTCIKIRHTIDNIIHAYFKELSHQGINVEQIFLYGSQVRGTARIDSDIDLVVVSRDFANMTPAEKWQKLGRATLALNEPIEVLPYTPLELQSSLKRKGNFIRHILSQPEIMEYRP